MKQNRMLHKIGMPLLAVGSLMISATKGGQVAAYVYQEDNPYTNEYQPDWYFYQTWQDPAMPNVDIYFGSEDIFFDWWYDNYVAGCPSFGTPYGGCY